MPFVSQRIHRLAKAVMEIDAEVSAASRCIGSCSQTVASPSMYRLTSGDKTKKPPLTQPPSPIGFSWNPVTRWH